MPGPVSDAYDPEFGTADNALRVREAVEHVRDIVSGCLGDDPLKQITQVIYEPCGDANPVYLSRRSLRVLHFALDRALESL